MKDYNIAKRTSQDEILEILTYLHTQKKQNRNLKYGRKAFDAFTEPTTVLEITGSGELYELHCAACPEVNNGAPAWIKVTVDGEKYIYVSFTNANTSTARYLYLHMMTAGYIRSADNGIWFMNGSDGSYDQASYSGGYWYLVGSGEDLEIPNGGDAHVEHMPPNAIRFSESVKVEVCNGKSYASFLSYSYSLDE